MRHPVSLRSIAIALRKKGYSIREITDKLGIAQSTSSLWLRNVKVSAEGKRRLQRRNLIGSYKTSVRWQQKRNQESKLYRDKAREIVKTLS